MDSASQDTVMTVQSTHDETRFWVDADSAIQLGERPHKEHDYVFVAERDASRCALLVGREIRDDWDERSAEEDTPAAVRVLARADELFLPLAEGTPAERLDRFSKGFREVVTQSQRELQRGAKDRTGEAPSLTLTLGYIDRLRLYLGHVGDDRCYVLRSGQLYRVTTDHTVASSESRGPKVNDPMLSRKVLNVIGGFADDLDTETLAMDLEGDDIVCLCTPGVWAAVPESTIGELLARAGGSSAQPLSAVADDMFRAVPEKDRRGDRAAAFARFRRPAEQ